MRRNSLRFVVALLLVFVLCSSYAHAANVEVDVKTKAVITVPGKADLMDCYQLAENTVKQYYQAEQIRTETDFGNVFLYESLNVYVQKRLEKARASLHLKSDELKGIVIGNDFTATCSLSEYDFRHDGLFIKLFISAEVRYEKDPDSYYFGNSVDVLLVKADGQLKISDILFYEDVMAEIPVLDSNRWDSQSNFATIYQVLKQMESSIAASTYMFENIDEHLASLQSAAETDVAETNARIQKQRKVLPDVVTKVAATYSFNRTAMVTYAKNTAPLLKYTDNKLYKDSSHTQSARGSSEAPYYYDFSSISNAYDCTNFASHVMLSGGAKMKNNGVSAPNTTNGGGWYFNNTNATGSTSRSESWSGVNQFGTFLLYNTGDGPRGQSTSYIEDLSSGDIVQWKYSDYNYPNYGHTTIVTGFYAQENYGFPKLTSRSSNGSFQIDQRFHDKLNQSNVIGYRLIALTGYVY
jgi:hypothetical protein